jgi:hypothetical protein
MRPRPDLPANVGKNNAADQRHGSRNSYRPLFITGGPMIEGLRLDITGAVLQTHIDRRIEHYRSRNDALTGQLDRLAQPGLEDTRDDDDPPYTFRGDSPVRSTRRRLERVEARLTMLAFLREHLVADEIYRLDPDDLTVLEILPDRTALW